MLRPLFDIKHDFEFYVWLKSSLPVRYRIQAEPASAYYTEWQYCYILYDGDEPIETVEGDFRDLPSGTLVRKAKELVDAIETGGR